MKMAAIDSVAAMAAKLISLALRGRAVAIFAVCSQRR